MTLPTKREASFAPVADANTRILILGSLPGAVSLEREQYYANRTNQFWRLLGPVVTTDLVALNYEARLASLLNAGVGLWDVIKSAQRRGSLDSGIRNHDPNRLREKIGALPSLRVIAFNGGTAAALGRRQLTGNLSVALVDLPSSSAAYCSISFEAKQTRWLKLRSYARETAI